MDDIFGVSVLCDSDIFVGGIYKPDYGDPWGIEYSVAKVLDVKNCNGVVWVRFVLGKHHPGSNNFLGIEYNQQNYALTSKKFKGRYNIRLNKS